MLKRYLEDLIRADALSQRKIAFISGPRQIGKSTLALNMIGAENQSSDYFNWDDVEFKKIWATNPKFLLESRINHTVIFDEIHKDFQWKSKLKGIYDLYKNKNHFIVTGSARLNFYRKSGDSLQGRYFPYSLHPFSYGEIPHLKPPPEKEWRSESLPVSPFRLSDLEVLGGFPDSILVGSEEKAQRWRNLYRERLVQEDIRDFSEIKMISQVDLLSLLLQDRVGAQLSYESLRRDLNASYESILTWIDALENIFYCFRIRPYSNKLNNMIRKEPKLYLRDWSFLKSPATRWENMVACHLLKNVNAWTEAAMGNFALFYLRDKQKREVDFFITKNEKPFLLLEVKSNSHSISPALEYYAQKLKPEFAIQLVREKRVPTSAVIKTSPVQLMSAEEFFGVLN